MKSVEHVKESLCADGIETCPETGKNELRVRNAPSARRADALAVVADRFSSTAQPR